MKKDLNRCEFIGRLGQDPDVRYTQSGGAVTTISVATSESWKDKATGEDVVKTEWHRIVFFGKLAEIAGEYLKKGSKLYVEGKLQTRKWQDQNQQDRYITEIVANEMQMLDSRQSSGGQGQFGGGQAPTAPRSNNPPQQNQKPQDPPASANPSMPASDFDDEIPF